MRRPPFTIPPEGKPYPETSPAPDLPALERQVLEYWADEGIFEETLDPERADGNPFDGALQESTAYDLPPVTRRLASPTDLLAGYVHDTCSRLRTMRGWYVPRPWVRPRHGIPVELEAQRRLELEGRDAIEAHGVDEFVTACAGVAFETDARWMELNRRQGHWIAFDEGFDPTIPDQMASVWWAFATLHEKGLVYEGTSKAPFSEELGTALSNFEVRLAGDGSPRSPYTDETTPQRLVHGWFLKLDPIREQLKRRIEDSQWYPRSLLDDALAWAEEAGDWCLTRDRYWGTPVPVWTNGEETRVLGSIAQLEELIGDRIPSDFHRGTLDELELPSSSGGSPLRRIPQILDPWFEVACMPFARVCYPEAAEEYFEARIPAGFTAQSRRHVRGWWFALAVVSTALFDDPAVLNIAGHAEVLDEEGHELGELEPELALALIDRHGSDPLRWSLIQGGASQETVRLQGDEAGGLRALWRHFDLFCRRANELELEVSSDDWPEYPDEDLDRWLLTKLHRRHGKLTDRVEHLDLAGAYATLAGFLGDLDWWGEQMAGRLNTEAGRPHLLTLHEVLVTFARVLAPFAPFVAELVYLSLSPGPSVHLERWPDLADLRTFEEAEARVEARRSA